MNTGYFICSKPRRSFAYVPDGSGLNGCVVVLCAVLCSAATKLTCGSVFHGWNLECCEKTLGVSFYQSLCNSSFLSCRFSGLIAGDKCVVCHCTSGGTDCLVVRDSVELSRCELGVLLLQRVTVCISICHTLV